MEKFMFYIPVEFQKIFELSIKTLGIFFLGLIIYWILVKRILPAVVKSIDDEIKSKYLKKTSLSGFLILLFITIENLVIFFNLMMYDQILNFLISFFVAYIIIESLKFFFIDYFLITVRNIKVPKLLVDIAVIVIYLLIIFTLLSTFFNIDVAPFIATSAVLSMVIGLALQDTLSNIFAGLTMQIDHPFGIGDWIKVNDLIGKVIEVNWRTTKIMTVNNEMIAFPNNMLSKTHVVNYSTTPVVPYNQSLCLEYSVKPESVRKIILDVVSSHPDILQDPAPSVSLSTFEDNYIRYGIRYFIKDFTQRVGIGNDVLERIWYRFKRENIDFPYPVRNIYINKKISSAETQQDSKAHIINMLRHVDFLSALDDSDIDHLASSSQLHLYKKNDVLFNQGDSGTDFYIINFGQVRVSGKTSEGENIEIAALGKGNFVGELSLLTGVDRSATVSFLEDTELIVLSKDALYPVFQKNPSVIEKICQIITKRQTEKKATIDKQVKADEEGLPIKHTDEAEKHAEPSNELFKKIKNFFKVV